MLPGVRDLVGTIYTRLGTDMIEVGSRGHGVLF